MISMLINDVSKNTKHVYNLGTEVRLGVQEAQVYHDLQVKRTDL